MEYIYNNYDCLVNEVSIMKYKESSQTPKIPKSRVDFMPFILLSICIKVHPMKQTLQIQLRAQHNNYMNVWQRMCQFSIYNTAESIKYNTSIYQAQEESKHCHSLIGNLRNSAWSILLHIVYTNLKLFNANN